MIGPPFQEFPSFPTTPFIFQNGGRLYTDDGLRTALDEPDAVKGMQALGNLFIA